MTDEGFYLLSSSNPSIYSWPSFFGYFLHRLPRIFANEIINFRGIDLILRICAASLPVAGLLYFLQKRTQIELTKLNAILMFVFAEIGALFTYSHGIRSLSYNGLTVALITAATAALISACSTNSRTARILFALISGFLPALTFFIKFPSFIAFEILLVVSALFSKPQRAIIFAHAGGLLLGAASYFCFFQEVSLWTRDFATVLISDTKNHAPAKMLVSLGSTFLKTVIPFSALGFCTGLVVASPNMTHRKSKTVIKTVGCIYLTALICLHNASSLIWWIGFTSAGFSLGCLYRRGLLYENRWTTSLLLTIGVLPFVTAIGSDNHPLDIGKFNMLSWFTFFGGLLYVASDRVFKSQIAWHSILLTTSMAATIQFFDGLVLHPYRILALSAQSESAQVPGALKGLQLDKQSKRYFEFAYDTMQRAGFQPHDPILVLYDGPGLVYALNGTSIGQAWYINMISYVQRNKTMLQSLANSKPDRLFLVIHHSWMRNQDLDPIMIRNLMDLGLNYPTDFQLLGKTQDYPQPNFLNEGTTTFYKWTKAENN